ncbi:MAG TPA: EAL domain-containing protein [Solirubrobacteraceae bacterium]|nr:EAL domain-containing protein [Solirubrobacteraceae bacterium]
MTDLTYPANLTPLLGEPLPRLMLVEDNAGDAVLVREMLRSALTEGFELVHAERLDEACEMLEEAGATCVLLDLSLPDAHGLEAVRRLLTVSPDVPIVVLTGLDDERLALTAVQEGAQDYLIKGRVDDHLIARSIRYAIERKRAEVELAHQALHDPLTGLPNRTLFLDRLALALARVQRRPAAVAVLFLDLDRFKVINDSLGHEIGDRLLMDLAIRLQEVLRPGDTVARFGGDEFTILCDDIDGERDAILIAERVGEAVAAPFVLGETEAFLTASVGIAMAQGRASRPEALIRDADAAMYRAKELGKSRYELFDEVMRDRALERLQVENDLHRAVERGELQVHYQPLVELPARRIVAVEALVRWQHPERGLLMPEQFVPLAEETGQIVELGGWVLRAACEQLGRWRAAGCADGLLLSVNLSARQLQQAHLVDDVMRALGDAGIVAGDLCLEITESVVVQERGIAIAALDALRSHGVRIAIDDFGTGYSSLRLLKDVPADLLKIDRSFVAGLGTDPQDTPIVRTVIGLAGALGLDAVAEGIETPAQLAELEAAGCRYGQGFHFARPMPAREVSALLAAGRRL